jgi:hypothetical protein
MEPYRQRAAPIVLRHAPGRVEGEPSRERQRDLRRSHPLSAQPLDPGRGWRLADARRNHHRSAPRCGLGRYPAAPRTARRDERRQGCTDAGMGRSFLRMVNSSSGQPGQSRILETRILLRSRQVWRVLVRGFQGFFISEAREPKDGEGTWRRGHMDASRSEARLAG